MSGAIRRKLMEVERSPTSINQWYKCATNFNRHWRESRREEKKLREQQENGAQAPRLNNTRAPQQQISQPQFWLRRQEAPQQQVPTEPVLIERVEKSNTVMVYPNQQVRFVPWQDSYTMEMDRENWNCYNCDIQLEIAETEE